MTTEINTYAEEWNKIQKERKTSPCFNVAKWCDTCGTFAGFMTSPEGQNCHDCGGWFCDDCMVAFTYCKECFEVYERKYPMCTVYEILDNLEESKC